MFGEHFWLWLAYDSRWPFEVAFFFDDFGGLDQISPVAAEVLAAFRVGRIRVANSSLCVAKSVARRNVEQSIFRHKIRDFGGHGVLGLHLRGGLVLFGNIGCHCCLIGHGVPARFLGAAARLAVAFANAARLTLPSDVASDF